MYPAEGKECHSELSDGFAGVIEIHYFPELFVDGPVRVTGDDATVVHEIVQAVVIIP